MKRRTMTNYHAPVLLQESINGLNIQENGVYVDVTFGGGGHSKAILECLGPSGKLFAFDQDEDAFANAHQDARFKLIKSNFKFFRNHLRLFGITKINGLLADLGVSSHQFDASERGFSIRFDAPLDMRMNQNDPLDAKTVVNTYEVPELTKVFRTYGEINEAYKLALTIEKKRAEKPIESTQELVKIAAPVNRNKKKEMQFLAQVFQAIRIEVNGELEVLKTLLTDATEMLAPEGRLSVISYHSLEDRLVKNFVRSGNFEGTVEKDIYGVAHTPLTAVNRKVLVPTEQEIESNNRARSAKLRIAEKV